MPQTFSSVSRSLGRSQAPAIVPSPPTIADAAVRLMAGSADELASTFSRTATAAKLYVIESTLASVGEDLLQLLRTTPARSAIVTRCALFDRIGLLAAVRDAGLAADHWDASTLDAAYDVDVGITDVYAAVAETGSIVVKSSPAHGRAVSLVPPVHIAVVERSQIVPDLIDLFEKLAADGTGSGVVVITGPSKTADIEMNLVVGVHGPGEVYVFLI